MTKKFFGQQNKISIGLEGSPSVIFLHGTQVDKSYHVPTIGFSGGFSFQYNFHRILSLRSGIAYERKGSKISTIYSDVNGYTIGTAIVHNNFDYLALPVLVRATVGNKVKCFFNGGAFAGYLISGKAVFRAPNSSKIISDHTSRDKRMDMGLVAGLGFLFPIQDKFSISFEIRNNLGLYNVNTYDQKYNGTTKTNSTNLLIGLIYNLGLLSTDKIE